MWPIDQLYIELGVQVSTHLRLCQWCHTTFLESVGTSSTILGYLSFMYVMNEFNTYYEEIWKKTIRDNSMIHDLMTMHNSWNPKLFGYLKRAEAKADVNVI